MGKYVKNFLVISLILCCLSTCDIFDDKYSLDYSEIEKFEYFTFTEKGTLVIRNAADYDALLINHWDWSLRDKNGINPVPHVNFDSHMVIIVHYGRKLNGCANAVDVITSIKTDDNKIYVNLRKLPELGTREAEAYPLQAVKLEKSSMKVIFEGHLP